MLLEVVALVLLVGVKVGKKVLFKNRLVKGL